MGIFLLLIIILWIVMQTPVFQHWIQGIVISEVEKKTGKLASINYVMIDILGNLQGKNFLLRDSISKDTFLYTQSFKIDITISKLFSGEIPIKMIEINDAIINIKKIDNQHWNYETLLTANPQDTATTNIQINDISANRLLINILDSHSMEHHISVLKISYKSKKSLFTQTLTSSTLIESLNWKMAYKPDPNSTIDFQKLWNDIVAFSPTQGIRLVKNNVVSIYQSNVMIQDMKTKKKIILISKFNLHTTPLKNGFKTLADFNINQIPIDLKFDVEETKSQKISCNNFEIKSLKSNLNMNVSLSKQNDLYSTIKTKLDEEDIRMIFPQYVLKQPIQLELFWKGNFDTGFSKIQLQIPHYIDLILNNQYVQKNNQYALYEQIEQCKLYFLNDTTSINTLYPAFKKWYPYFITDEINIKGEGYWYNHSWTINTKLQNNNGSITINGSKQNNHFSFLEGANIRMDIDSFCFKNIFNKGIYNTHILMNFDTFQNTLQAHIEKVVLKDYEFSDITINNIFKEKKDVFTIDIQDKNIRTNTIIEYRKIADNHFVNNIKSTLENVKIDGLKDIALNIFKDSSLLIFRDSVSIFGKMELTIEDINHKKKILLQSPMMALYTYRKDDYFYLHNIQFAYQDKENEDITIDLKSSLINGVFQFNKKSFSPSRIMNYFTNTYITNYTFGFIDKKDTLLHDFIFTLQAYNLKLLNRYFSYPLRNVDTLDLLISYQKNSNKLKTNLLVKNLKYATISMEKLRVKNDGKDSNIDLQIDMNQLIVNNHKWVNQGNVQFQIRKNNLLLDIATDSSMMLGKVHFNNELSFLENRSVCLKVNDISVDFLNRKYRTTQKGIFYWGEHLVVSDSFLAVQEMGKEEQLIIRPVYDEEGKKEDIQFTLSQVDLTTFNDVLKSYSTKLKGFFTIQCNIRNILNSKEITIDYNGFFKDLILNDVSIGTPVFTGNYYPLKKDIYYDIDNDDDNFAISSTGHINLGDKKHAMYSDIVLNVMRMPIGFIQPYLTGIFDYLDATLQGKINISQRNQKMSIHGQLTTPKVLLRISYTQADYMVDTVKIIFRDSTLFFEETKFRDYENAQNIGYIKCDFSQNNLFATLEYGVHIRTPGILVFNTDVKTGDVYSLVAKAKGTFDLTGNKKQIFLRAKAYPLEGAKLVVYSSRSTGNNSLGNFITFKDYNSKNELAEKDSTSNFFLDILVDVDAQSTIGADIWTSNTGDQKIQTEGIGTLRVVSNPQNPFGLYGRYNIERGSYNLPIEYTEKLLLIDPRFNNYIEWTGDVNGKLNINLIYNIANADFNALLSSSSTTSTSSLVPDQFKNFRGPVDVLMKVSSSILNPFFKFDLEIPSNNVLKNNPETKSFFDRIQSNETELLRQVSYLFITNSFAPPDNVINSSVLVSGVTGAVSSAVSSQINNLLAKSFAKIAPTLKFNLITDVYGSNAPNLSGGNNTAIDRMKLGASISQSLFDNRFSYSVSTAGDFGWGNTNNKATFLPDAEARYNIKKDGSIYVRAFINNSVSQGENYSYGKNSRQGGGIGFRKEFNSFKDLFTFTKDTTNKKKKLKNKIKKDTTSH